MIYAACDDPTAPTGTPVVPGTAVPGNALDVVLAEFVQDDGELAVSDRLTLTVVEPAAQLELLDLRSTCGQATRAGTHLSRAPHSRTQPWARAIRAAYPRLHGILYVPATGGRAVAVALDETAAGTLQAGRVVLSRQLDDAALLLVVASAAARLGFAVTRSWGRWTTTGGRRDTPGQ